MAAAKTAVATVLFKVLMPIALLAAAIVRFNGLSGVYLLCLMALPLMPNPTRISMAGRTGLYLIILIILGSLACITQLLFQILVLTDAVDTSQLEACNGTESLWRQLGYQRLDDLDAADVSRLIVPDVLVLVVSIVVFAISKVLLKPSANPAEEESVDTGEVYHRRQIHQSVVAEGIRSFCVMVLCGLVAVILPSAISAFYFLTFLVVVTWWSTYHVWGSKFNIWVLLWLLYSGAHLILLYLYQFPFFQEAVPPEFTTETDENFFQRLFGLTAIVDETICNPLDDPRILDIIKDHPWPVYVNPVLILAFYLYLATQIRVWMDGPTKGYEYLKYKTPQHEKVPRRQRKEKEGEREDEAQAQGQKKDSKKNGFKEGKDSSGTKDEETPVSDEDKEKRLMSGSKASYQALDETTEGEDVPEEVKERADVERAPSHSSVLSRDDGKLSPIGTFVVYCTKQCYLAALILMMAWSITYHSWLTFVMLLWACAIWIVPQEPPEKGPLHVATLGVLCHLSPHYPVYIWLLYTCMFWLTLRQFLRERKLASVTQQSSGGMTLQPFGMIFSGPKEEVSALTEQMKEGGSEAVDVGQSETMAAIGGTVMKLFAKYWIFLCGAMFLIVSLEAKVDIFKIIYMGLFLIIVNIFVLNFTLFRFISKPFAWIVVLYSVCTLALIYTYQFEDFPGYWTNNTMLTEEILAELGLMQYSTSELLVNLLIPTTFIIVFMVQLHYYHDHFLTMSIIKPSGYNSDAASQICFRCPDEVRGTSDDTSDEVRNTSDKSSTNKELVHQPGNLKEEKDEGEGKEEGGDAIEEAGGSGQAKEGEETDKPQTRKRTKSKLKHYTRYLLRSIRQYYGKVTRAIWRCLEIHMVKVVLFTVVIVACKEVSAVNGVLILLIFLAIPFPSLYRLATMFTLLWASAVLFVKMVYQLHLVPVEDWVMDCNDTNNGDFPIQSNFSKVEWFGFEQVNNFSNYVIGYVAIILMLMLHSIVVLHQRQYRHENNIVKVKDTIVFPTIKRENADEGLFCAFKFFANYCFYKFGLEASYSSVSVAFLCHVIGHTVPCRYAVALGVPTLLCWIYPWTGMIPDEFITWLYFPDYLVRPDPIFILADFFQLLFVCLQWQVFRTEKTIGTSYPGGDNYEGTVDERISRKILCQILYSTSHIWTS
ncbi:piezo-type mechanosensitive ion channel component 2-like [Amphiura filiformis]|uniref:piezo-type mechanosensitive ion channel component 2-like n=1 Tax=Amphiura filiformis TaxID=82378 RepID=UPI003B21F535